MRNKWVQLVRPSAHRGNEPARKIEDLTVMASLTGMFRWVVFGLRYSIYQQGERCRCQIKAKRCGWLYGEIYKFRKLRSAIPTSSKRTSTLTSICPPLAKTHFLSPCLKCGRVERRLSLPIVAESLNMSKKRDALWDLTRLSFMKPFRVCFLMKLGEYAHQNSVKN